MRARNVVRVAVCTAMLIGGQLALSAVSGIEIVTVLLLCFCFSYGIKTGVAIATCFSLLRCLVFGFYLNVVVIYLVYYNLFAVFFGWLGKRLSSKPSLKRTLIVVASASVLTVFFTLFDNLLTPLMYGYSANAVRAYFLASLYAVVPQTVCTVVTVSAFFDILTGTIEKIKF